MTIHADTNICQLWRELMTLQTDLLFPAELPFYVRSPHWKRARNVVDLGTGNGYYLGRLADVFPRKNYTGIDIVESHLDEARKCESTRRNSHRADINFIHSDLYSLSGNYDAVIARLCIQHLNSLYEFAEQVKEIVDEGGSLFVIESCDEDRTFIPEVPLLSAFFEELRANRRQAVQDRDAGRIMLDAAKDFGFFGAESMIVTTSSEAPSAKETFLKTYLTASELVKADFGMAFDYQSLRQELRNWAATLGSYTHLSVRVTRYNIGRT